MVKSQRARRRRNTQFWDHMHCRSNLMVSRKAEASIRKLRLVPGTRLVHTTVLDRGKEIAQVTAIIFSRLLRVIDKEKSESGTFGSYVPLRVSEPIIKYKAVRRFDLMQAYDIHWVCSEALKSEVDSAGLTNFTFVPLKMSGK